MLARVRFLIRCRIGAEELKALYTQCVCLCCVVCVRRCLDLDCDGVIRPREMYYFYGEKHRRTQTHTHTHKHKHKNTNTEARRTLSDRQGTVVQVASGTRCVCVYMYTEDQVKRLEGLSQEPVLFPDILCQLHDMLQPEVEGEYTLR